MNVIKNFLLKATFNYKMKKANYAINDNFLIFYFTSNFKIINKCMIKFFNKILFRPF